MFSFLGLLTMQVGVLVLSTSFNTIAVCVMLANLLSLYWETVLPWIIVMMFCTFIIVTWITAFYGAYTESLKILQAVFIMWSIIIVIWIIIILCSLIPGNSKNVCIGYRCPETLWLVNNPRSNMISNFNDVKVCIPVKEQNKDVHIHQLLFEENHTQTICETSKNHENCQHGQLNSPPRAATQQQDLGTSIIVSLIVLSMYLVSFIYSWIFLKNYKTCIRLKHSNIAGTSNGIPNQLRTVITENTPHS